MKFNFEDFTIVKVPLKKRRTSKSSHQLCKPCIFYDKEKSLSNDIFCMAGNQGIDFVGCHSDMTHTYVYKKKLTIVLKNL